MVTHRVHSLDYLRGIMAFLIMIYHYIIWVSELQGAESFFGRVGVYGVSIFYIISGLTLFLVYQNKLCFRLNSIAAFFIRRFFRIYPILWISMLLILFFEKKSHSAMHLFLSFSGLFGFVAPTQYIGLVSWSIGNELVFYSIFPFLIILFKIRPIVFYSLVFGLSLLNFYFIFFAFNPKGTLHDQWHVYVNPLNHIILFLIGILTGVILQNNNKLNRGLVICILISSTTLLFLYPVSGDWVELVYGFPRVLFIICSAVICFSIFSLNFEFHKWIHLILSNIGKVSYSLYLFHPIIFILLIKLNNQFLDFKIRYIFIIYILCNLIISNIVYEIVEKPMILLGRKVISRLNLKLFNKI